MLVCHEATIKLHCMVKWSGDEFILHCCLMCFALNVMLLTAFRTYVTSRLIKTIRIDKDEEKF